MTTAVLNLAIAQGKTYSKSFRWGMGRRLYAVISSATKAAPCVLSAVAHGIPDGWSFAISNVVGMTALNSENRDVNGGLYSATVIDEDTIELNDVNSVGFKSYVSGGIITFNEPVDLTGYTARLQVRKTAASEDVLLELTTENGGIAIDAAEHTVSLFISATDTAAIEWTDGVYELEMVSDPLVVSLIKGSVKVTREITR